MAGIKRVDIGGSYLKDTSPVGSFADMLMKQGAQWQKQAADEEEKKLAQQRYETELGFKQRAEDRQIDELKRQQNARDALVNYKFDPITALDKQRELADQALISKYEELNKKAAEDPSFNPALNAEEARQLQSFYEQQTPWQEQVQATVYNDLVAKGVDDKSALARATALATPYKSLKEAQATEDLLAKTTNEARDKAFDRKLKMIDMTRKLIDESGSGSSKDGKAGGNLAELISKLGNSSASLNAAITEARKVEGVTDKDIVNGLVALGAKEGVDWYDLTDYRNKDVDLSKLPEAIELVKSGKSNVNKDKADILTKLTALENSYGKTAALDVEEEAKKKMATGMSSVLDKIFGKSAGTTTSASVEGKNTTTTVKTNEDSKVANTDLFDEAQPYVNEFDKRMQKNLEGAGVSLNKYDKDLENVNKGLKERSKNGQLTPAEVTLMKLGMHPEQREVERNKELRKSQNDLLQKKIELEKETRRELKEKAAATKKAKEDEAKVLILRNLAESNPSIMEDYKKAKKQADRKAGYIGTSSSALSFKDFASSGSLDKYLQKSQVDDYVKNEMSRSINNNTQEGRLENIIKAFNSNTLNTAQKRWIESMKQTPQTRKTLRELGLDNKHMDQSVTSEMTSAIKNNKSKYLQGWNNMTPKQQKAYGTLDDYLEYRAATDLYNAGQVRDLTGTKAFKDLY